jgi:mRNA interferase HicA
MKKRDLVKHLRAVARATGTDLLFVREGANHEVWAIAGERLVIPRHREINELTARAIIRRAEEVTTDGDG